MSVKDYVDKETFLANLEYELICDLVAQKIRVTASY